jgi:hypothetical protein
MSGAPHAVVDPTSIQLSDVAAPSATVISVTLSGPALSPRKRILLYDSDEWEEFIREWVTGLQQEYAQIKRMGGPGDRGADIAAFKTDRGFEGPWDCYQGKHYQQGLTFSDAAPEILKVLLGVLDDQYCMPDAYFFVAPRGCGISLNKLLSQPATLRTKFTAKLVAGDPLVGSLNTDRVRAAKALAERTDFSVFKSAEPFDVLRVHQRTQWHAGRFGTSLAARPVAEVPPTAIDDMETRYVEQLISVYRERYPQDEISASSVQSHARLARHFQHQRERFYKAESLRMYARDSVPPGTFEKLQDDIYSGVVDSAMIDHETGWARLHAVLEQASRLELQQHILIAVSDQDDRKGICHQLANTDGLIWIPHYE